MSAPIIRPQQIELPAFSGPLDLLLHLIERNELDVTAISLAKVAEQFLAQVERLKEERIEQLIDFLIIGAQLVLIKSRALLPKPPAILATEEDEEDPAEALARRLRAYKQFKEVARWLAEREELGWRTYLRIAPLPQSQRESQLDTSNLSLDVLRKAMVDALLRAERLDESVRVAQKPKITIEGQIGRLRRAIRLYGSFPFRDLLSASPSRAELSVSLLAVLELTKRHEIMLFQNELFGPIEISSYVSPEYAAK